MQTKGRADEVSRALGAGSVLRWAKRGSNIFETGSGNHNFVFIRMLRGCGFSYLTFPVARIRKHIYACVSRIGRCSLYGVRAAEASRVSLDYPIIVTISRKSRQLEGVAKGTWIIETSSHLTANLSKLLPAAHFWQS